MCKTSTHPPVPKKHMIQLLFGIPPFSSSWRSSIVVFYVLVISKLSSGNAQFPRAMVQRTLAVHRPILDFTQIRVAVRKSNGTDPIRLTVDDGSADAPAGLVDAIWLSTNDGKTAKAVTPTRR